MKAPRSVSSHREPGSCPLCPKTSIPSCNTTPEVQNSGHKPRALSRPFVQASSNAQGWSCWGKSRGSGMCAYQTTRDVKQSEVHKGEGVGQRPATNCANLHDDLRATSHGGRRVSQIVALTKRRWIAFATWAQCCVDTVYKRKAGSEGRHEVAGEQVMRKVVALEKLRGGGGGNGGDEDVELPFQTSGAVP